MREADEEAFRAFFRAEFGGTVTRLVVVTQSRAEAEDAAQEAFVRTLSQCGYPPEWPTPRPQSSPLRRDPSHQFGYGRRL
ncbi:MAG: hypothetical protein NVSMB57_06520 [Actinomycetota bacterium]